MNLCWSFVLLLTALLVGCQKPDPTPSRQENPTPRAVESDGIPATPTRAQERLQTIKLYLGAEEMKSELALSMEQIMTGMMFRTNMAENEGMLFIFAQPHQASFWMKNTSVPLSAAYINAQGVIEEIHAFTPHDTNSVTAASSRIQYVLETPQGWFDRHQVSTGAVVRTEFGTLEQTFEKRR